MYQFTDFEECKVDSKGRFMLPVVYRKGLGDALAEGFVMKSDIGIKVIRLYTKSGWDKENEKFQSLNKFDPKNQQVIRIWMAGKRNVEVDSSGRLQIPRDLLTEAEIENEISLSPAFGYLEIWSTKNYKDELAAINKNAVALFEEVLGGNEKGK